MIGTKGVSFWETHPVQVMPFLSSKLWIFLDALSCFASVGWRVLKCSKIVSRSKGGSSYPWNHTERWISQPIFAGLQSPLDDLRWGWVFLERTWILSGIQFTTHFIEIFVVETKRFVGIFENVILTRQTCGQRSSRATESKRRALWKCFSGRICYVFLISKRRGDWDLVLCTTSVLAFGEPQRNDKTHFFIRQNTFFLYVKTCFFFFGFVFLMGSSSAFFFVHLFLIWDCLLIVNLSFGLLFVMPSHS